MCRWHWLYDQQRAGILKIETFLTWRNDGDSRSHELGDRKFMQSVVERRLNWIYRPSKASMIRSKKKRPVQT